MGESKFSNGKKSVTIMWTSMFSLKLIWAAVKIGHLIANLPNVKLN